MTLDGEKDQDTGKFPDILPDADRAGWSRLSVEKRIEAHRRIAAIEAVLGGSTISAAANAYELRRPRLSQLIKSWSADPTLRGLGLYVNSASHRSAKIYRAEKQLVIEAAWTMFKAGEATRKTEQIVEALIAGPLKGHKLPSLDVMRGYVNEARQGWCARTGVFGREIALDITALAAKAGPDDLFALAAVVDVETTFLLGWSCMPLASAPNATVAAASDAIARLSGLAMAAPISRTVDLARLELHAGSGQSPDIIRTMRMTKALGWVANPLKRGAGVSLLRALGQDLGRVRMKPSWLQSYREAIERNPSLPIMSEEEASDLADIAITAHNKAVLDQRGPADANGLAYLRPQIERLLSEITRL